MLPFAERVNNLLLNLWGLLRQLTGQEIGIGMCVWGAGGLGNRWRLYPGQLASQRWFKPLWRI